MTRKEVKKSWNRIRNYRNNRSCDCVINKNCIDDLIKLAILLKNIDFAEHWEILQGFKNGRDVEFKREGMGWTETSDPNFCSDNEYRLKPEWKPFSYEDAEDLIGKKVKRKDLVTCAFQIVAGVENQGVYLSVSGRTRFTELADKYVFIDGEPCKKRINN